MITVDVFIGCAPKQLCEMASSVQFQNPSFGVLWEKQFTSAYWWKRSMKWSKYSCVQIIDDENVRWVRCIVQHGQKKGGVKWTCGKAELFIPLPFLFSVRTMAFCLLGFWFLNLQSALLFILCFLLRILRDRFPFLWWQLTIWAWWCWGRWWKWCSWPRRHFTAWNRNHGLQEIFTCRTAPRWTLSGFRRSPWRGLTCTLRLFSRRLDRHSSLRRRTMAKPLCLFDIDQVKADFADSFWTVFVKTRDDSFLRWAHATHHLPTIATMMLFNTQTMTVKKHAKSFDTKGFNKRVAWRL